MMWAVLIGASVACYLLKLAGLTLPARVIEHPVVRRYAALLPVALLSALVVVQALATGRDLAIDARAVAIGVALAAVLLRAPFLIVVLAAAATAALVRMLNG